tara:strand:- start:154 stop:534 length:381 start_codon:yes stop_codon:yes gene_type:complete
MKLYHFYKIILPFFVIFIFFTPHVLSIENLDEKVKKLTLELRCMTCQNQSVYDSDADFSNDIKKIVKDKFKEGESEIEIKEFLVDRYGEYILFRPLLNYKNMFLWTFPFILLAISLFFIILKIRKR